MSRVVRLVRPSLRRSAAFAAALVAAISLSGAPAAAQDLPDCSEDRGHDCVLPNWSSGAEQDLPSLFGEIEGAVWVTDPTGDAPPAGLDILAVGIGSVDVTDAPSIRSSDDLLKQGTRKKAVPNGVGTLVRIVLDRPLEAIDGGHSGIHVATDVNASRNSNAPTGVGSADNPFAGSQDVYSLSYASTTGGSRLLSSNLARAWYKDSTPYAAAWAAPNVLDLLIAPEEMGAGIRAMSFVSGSEGGYDSATAGVAPIPIDGRVGLVPVCIEGSVSAQPFVVSRLVENDQTLRDVEAPASWRGGATVPVSGDERAALESLIASLDEDGDGAIGLPAIVDLFEDGVVIRQRPELGLRLEGNAAQLSLELGLTRRGYNAISDIDVEPTGDALSDAWLERATASLGEHLPPFRAARKAGLVAGDGIGTCLAAFVPPPEAVVEPSGEPDVGAAAASA